MKIRTQQDIDQLDQKVKTEIGIDVSKYRNEEVIQNFVDLLVFPEYVLTWVIRPILISLVLYIVGFKVIDLVHIEYVIYSIIGLVLFLLTGLFFGLLLLTFRMKKDMSRVLTYTLAVMKTSLADVKQVNTQVTPENRKDVLSLLFKGILHIVTIPVITQVIEDKFFLIGGILSKFINRIFTLLSDKITFEAIQKTRTEEGSPISMESNIQSIEDNIELINTTLRVTFGIAQFPLKIIFTILILLLIGFLYLIW